MANTQKYTILNKIENDASFGTLNYCTISFLTPTKVEKTKYLDILGFKIHDGYNSYECCDQDAVKIKDKNKNHDVYIMEMGKVYAWDDATKSDSLQYDDKKLNDLEKTRRENVDKIKLMSEQNKNNYTPMPTKKKNRQEDMARRLQKQLYDKGKITKYEWEMINETNKPVKLIKEEAAARQEMDKQMADTDKVDYLDENDSVGLKFGCVTIYSPNKIKGLGQMCIKVRGLFETLEEAQERCRKLHTTHKNDQIHIFEVGKWCAYVEEPNVAHKTQLSRLNFAMKCYLDNLEIEMSEFEKRKEALISKNEKETNDNKEKTFVEKKKKGGAKKVPAKTEAPKNSFTSIGDKEDDTNIQSLMEYLEDPELDEIMATKKVPSSTGERVEINI